MENKFENIIKKDGFIYGVNIPWFNHNSYGSDIGTSYREPICKFDSDLVYEIFNTCKSIGFNCVRIWLHEIMEGITFDKDGYATGYTPLFADNLSTICDIAESLNINLIVTFQPHISYSIPDPKDYEFYTQILHKPEYTKTYIDNCVKPITELLSTKKSVVMLDIYAEPEGDITGKDGNMQPYGYSWDKILTYIKAVRNAIKECAPLLPITVASGWRNYDSLKEGRYNELGLDYIGVDIYNNEGYVLPVSELNTNGIPVWLAEFGPTDKYNWDEEFYTQNTTNFYENAMKNGYCGAFIWMYGYKESSEALTLVGKDGKLRPCTNAIHKLKN